MKMNICCIFGQDNEWSNCGGTGRALAWLCQMAARTLDKEKGKKNEAESDDIKKRGNAEVDCQKAGWDYAG